MLRYRKRHPAAPELLGSKGVDGAERFGLRACDHEDTPAACCNQPCWAPCGTSRHPARPWYRPVRARALPDPGRSP